MKSFVLVLVVVFAFFADSGSTRDINDVIFHALDVVLRNEMRNGNPYTGFPVMAPYQAPEEAVSLNFNQLVELDGNLQTVRIDGLDGYSISEVNLNLATMRLNFDFTWPQLLFTGRYNLNGRFAGLIPIFGQGSYHIDPKSEFSLLLMSASGKSFIISKSNHSILFRCPWIWLRNDSICWAEQ